MDTKEILDLAARSALRVEELEIELTLANDKVDLLHGILITYVNNVCEAGCEEHILLMSTLEQVMQSDRCSGNLH